MSQTKTVQVEVVPAKGEKQTHSVEVVSSGCSYDELLKLGRIDGKKFQGMVDGEPASSKTHVGPESKVLLTERASGS